MSIISIISGGEQYSKLEGVCVCVCVCVCVGGGKSYEVGNIQEVCKSQY